MGSIPEVIRISPWDQTRLESREIKKESPAIRRFCLLILN
jgi:hypothetical protein